MVTRHGNPSRHGNTCGKLSIVIVTLRVPGRGAGPSGNRDSGRKELHTWRESGVLSPIPSHIYLDV